MSNTNQNQWGDPPTALELDVIPQTVVDDIRKHYSSVSFQNYGKPVTEKCRSRRSTVEDLVKENVDATWANPETFAPEMIKGADIYMGYMIRGEFDVDVADIYAVIPVSQVKKKPTSQVFPMVLSDTDERAD